MSKGLGLLLALVLIAVGAVYAASPFFAFHQLKDAARSGDREQLEAMVDFPAVRDDLKRQIDSKATKLARKAGKSTMASSCSRSPLRAASFSWWKAKNGEAA